ncbi:MAG: hypothetical protein PHT54_03605 [Candidatus Nanoarchaeia archaeon]|nr:hypothetical protein [Candidatus Nanoarchaeia archaeon]
MNNKKWEELTDKEKEEWEVLAKNITPLQKFWISLCLMRKCIYCKTKFEEGITRKHPRENNFPLNAYFWFTAKFLVHCQTTHGYCPEDITMFLEKIAEK